MRHRPAAKRKKAFMSSRPGREHSARSARSSFHGEPAGCSVQGTREALPGARLLS